MKLSELNKIREAIKILITYKEWLQVDLVRVDKNKINSGLGNTLGAVEYHIKNYKFK